MLRIAIAAVLVLAISVQVSRADTLPLVGVPSGYTPGVTFSFDISAPGLNGLTDYMLAFTVTAGRRSRIPSPPTR